MAAFDSQVSAQISTETKIGLGRARTADNMVNLGTSEADVIRLALYLGLRELDRIPPEKRVAAYALMHRSLDFSGAIA